MSRGILFFIITVLIQPAFAGSECGRFFDVEKKRYAVPKDHETLFKMGQGAQLSIPKDAFFDVVSWNIYKGKEKNFWSDFQNLKITADILLLQETVHSVNHCQHYSSFQNFHWSTAISFWLKNNIATGVTTGSVFDSISTDFVRSSQREPVIKTPKMAIISDYKFQDSDLILKTVNLHGVNFVSAKDFNTQLDEIYEKIRNHYGPLIVAGDFNTRNKKRFKYLKAFTSQLNLEMVFYPNDFRKDKLDHIFIRGLKSTKSEILYDFKSSDHPLLWTKLSLKN